MRQNFDELPVLIAEDSDNDRILLQDALERVGVRNPQMVATNGEQTLSLLPQAGAGESQPFPGILFLDLLMPPPNGIEILEWLHSHEHPPITVVLHTGVEDDELLRRARDLGANLYLPKGVRIDAIDEVFRRARAEWEQFQMVKG
jgi:CheY-like chemotaxis protein